MAKAAKYSITNVAGAAVHNGDTTVDSIRREQKQRSVGYHGQMVQMETYTPMRGG
jgi:hypothetical protein